MDEVKAPLSDYNALDLNGTYPLVVTPPQIGTTKIIYLGDKRYELSNHLGNVMAVISDRKIMVDDNSDNVLDFYMPEYYSFGMYYAFGASLPGRSNSNSTYKYDFYGQENENDNNAYDLGARFYDSRLGRMFSIDPLADSYTNVPLLFNVGPSGGARIDFKYAVNIHGAVILLRVLQINFTRPLNTVQVLVPTGIFGIPRWNKFKTIHDRNNIDLRTRIRTDVKQLNFEDKK